MGRMTTTPLRHIAQLAHPGEILAAIPHLLGFHPENSLVLITLHGLPGMTRVGTTLRVDLPSAEDRHGLAAYLLSSPVVRRQADAVLLVVVGGAQHIGDDHDNPRPDQEPPPTTPSDEDGPPHHDLIHELRETFGTAGIPVLHAVWTDQIRAGTHWRCYDEDDCEGEVNDPRSSSVGVATVASGLVTFGSREEIEALIKPESPDAVARRTARLDAMLEEQGLHRRPPGSAQRDWDVVLGAVHRTAEGTPLTEDDFLRVLMALSDNRVRDLALSTALGEWSSAAEQLWITLVRKAPPPELADVAALLAFSAYLRGDGVLAGIALGRIEEVRPEHRLGVLLRQALDAGITPSQLRGVAEDAVEDAKTLMEEDGEW